MRLPGLAVAAGMGAAAALAQAQPDQPVDHATVRLWAAEPLAAGKTSTLVLDFAIDEGWHLYWNGLNDTGFPPEIEWTLPEGFELAGPVRWPAPTRHVSPGPLLDHVYEKRVMLFAPVRVPSGAVGTAHFEADLKWLVCKDVCLPGDAHVALDVEVDGPAPPLSHADAAALRESRARVPTAPPTHGGVRVALAGNICDIWVPGASGLEFFPLPECSTPADLLKEGVAEGEVLRVTLKPKQGTPNRVAGVLRVTAGADAPPKFWTIDTAAAAENR